MGETTTTAGRTAAKRNVVIHADPAWVRWLDSLASACRLSRAGLLDQAAARLARELGHQEPPPR